MSDTPDNFTIGVLAAAGGVTVETIRFYQRKGLLSEPPRSHGSVRRYTLADVARVQFIKAAQRIDFTLGEIALLLQLEDGTQCSRAREVASSKLAVVRQKLSDLERIEAALARLVDQCATVRGEASCPLIEFLQEAR
jgi:MerR family mercuric resistance operon transcriptional regulator